MVETRYGQAQCCVADKEIWMSDSAVDVGIGADLELKALKRKGFISDLRVKEFRKDSQKGLSLM